MYTMSCFQCLSRIVVESFESTFSLVWVNSIKYSTNVQQFSIHFHTQYSCTSPAFSGFRATMPRSALSPACFCPRNSKVMASLKLAVTNCKDGKKAVACCYNSCTVLRIILLSWWFILIHDVMMQHLRHLRQKGGEKNFAELLGAKRSRPSWTKAPLSTPRLVSSSPENCDCFWRCLEILLLLYASPLDVLYSNFQPEVMAFSQVRTPWNELVIDGDPVRHRIKVGPMDQTEATLSLGEHDQNIETFWVTADGFMAAHATEWAYSSGVQSVFASLSRTQCSFLAGAPGMTAAELFSQVVLSLLKTWSLPHEIVSFPQMPTPARKNRLVTHQASIPTLGLSFLSCRPPDLPPISQTSIHFRGSFWEPPPEFSCFGSTWSGAMWAPGRYQVQLSPLKSYPIPPVVTGLSNVASACHRWRSPNDKNPWDGIE